MQTLEAASPHSRSEPACAGDDYYGNPYRTPHEQYGLEFLDRNFNGEDDIEGVVILGYN